jgi:membrane protein DedA with SNARE-associated domain
MKKKFEFAGFLISRFKGLIFYAIGIGILIYLTVQNIVVPAREINYGINIFLSVFALILMAVGLFLRRNFKKSETE